MFQLTRCSFWMIRLAGALALLGLAVWLPAAPAYADEAVDPAVEPAIEPLSPDQPMACIDGEQDSGALYRICMPFIWGNDLVVFAHGYMSPDEDIRIPEEQLVLPDGTSIPDRVNLLGLAFATTSYSVNGLAIRPGMADLVDLVDIFRQLHPQLRRVYLVGASEGGLITALSVEQYPGVFDGGLATCGPVGDFRKQIDYVGDFRVVFDYFFPGLMPGSPISIPQTLRENWDAHYQTTILPAILEPANAVSVTQLLNVTGAAYVPTDTETISNTIRTVLWYNVFATNDAVAKLGGQPFDNQSRVYAGSADDDALNAGAQRFSADPAALDALEADYQTSGQLRAPLVTLHTTLDEIVPYWHEPLYQAKVAAQGRAHRHDNFPPGARYGHCNFTSAEVEAALGLLISRIVNTPAVDVDLSPGYSQPARPGGAVTYQHVITNTGSTSGTFILEAASLRRWPVTLLGGAYSTGTLRLPVQLGAGLTATVQLSLTAPADAADGVVEWTVITATSQVSPSVFIAVADVTVIDTSRYVFLPLVLKTG